jgi:hypothetical protein
MILFSPLQTNPHRMFAPVRVGSFIPWLSSAKRVGLVSGVSSPSSDLSFDLQGEPAPTVMDLSTTCWVKS